MNCPICDQKPANCECTSLEREQFNEIESLKEQITSLTLEIERQRKGMSSVKRSRSGVQVAQKSDSKTEVESVDADQEFWSLATEIQEEIVESQWRWLQSLDVVDAIKSEIYIKLCECTGAAITIIEGYAGNTRVK